MTGRVVLHAGPHPDDELLGAPAALMALRDQGWRVVVLACSLGAAREQAARRAAELRDACGRAGFDLREPLGPLDLSAPGARTAVAAQVREAVAASRPAVVVSPSPDDGHPSHVVVGRAVGDVLAGTPAPVAWWMWGLWADLPHPNVLVTFGRERLDEILGALEAHRGELERNDYRRLLVGRAMMNAVLGPERVFGFGSAGRPHAGYAELLTEVVATGQGWRWAAPRRLDAAAPVSAAGAPLPPRVAAWLERAGCRPPRPADR